MIRRLGWLAVACVAAAALPASAGAVAAPTDSVSWSARIVMATSARAEPRDGARVVGKVRTRAPWNEGPMQLLVADVATDADGHLWIKLLLAKKPNGSYGWIPADYAQLHENRWRVVVDLSERRTTIFRDGRPVRSTRAVVGAKGTPTPTGEFAIREVVRQPDASGFSGPWIFHLNANSQKLKSFDGGDGTIGIHGRGAAAMGDPLGSARSHGCVRVPNAFVRYMSSRIAAGTPVRIRR
ncbi:MAG: L,D-transpeptidase [Solirubrobacterales bacterium]